MHFRNRKEAGKLLAKKLSKFKENAVVYALPRGGVVLGEEVARELRAPLSIVITRKIGHPYNPEYAIAAIAEDGTMLENQEELSQVKKSWLNKEIEKEKKEAKRRKKLYLKNVPPVNPKGKTAIIIDDGIATGLTIRVAVLKIKKEKPQKLIVAIPVAPRSSVDLILKDADAVFSLDVPDDSGYLGSVGAYYAEFSQVPDKKVIDILKSYNEKY